MHHHYLTGWQWYHTYMVGSLLHWGLCKALQRTTNSLLQVSRHTHHGAIAIVSATCSHGCWTTSSLTRAIDGQRSFGWKFVTRTLALRPLQRQFTSSWCVYLGRKGGGGYMYWYVSRYLSKPSLQPDHVMAQYVLRMMISQHMFYQAELIGTSVHGFEGWESSPPLPHLGTRCCAVQRWFVFISPTQREKKVTFSAWCEDQQLKTVSEKHLIIPCSKPWHSRPLCAVVFCA